MLHFQLLPARNPILSMGKNDAFLPWLHQCYWLLQKYTVIFGPIVVKKKTKTKKKLCIPRKNIGCASALRYWGRTGLSFYIYI